MKRMLERAVAFATLFTLPLLQFAGEGSALSRRVPDFAEAERAIPKGRPEGFNLEAVPDFFIGKQFLFNQQDYPVLLWLTQAMEPGGKVFDLGGGFGQCYYNYREYVPYPEGLQWLVCDVESFLSPRKGVCGQAQREESLLHDGSQRR